MNIEDLTIREAREIAAMFASAAKPNPLERFLGKMVVVRDNQAGVYCGRVESVTEDTITLAAGSRQAWYWQFGGSCAGLAAHGPDGFGSKITAPSPGPIAMFHLVAIHECSEASTAQWAKIPAWEGK